MLDPQTSRFWQATTLSGLMDAEGLTACWHAIPPEKRDAPAHIDRRLARQAVQSNALTLWQAQQLLAGRTGGFKVDRYILLDLIGQGGMGRVYLARDTRLNRRVALKILSPERINNPRAIARFQREARVGAQLQHENLVRIYDFGESSGRYYLVMEFIEGKTIGNLISDQGPMPPGAATQLVRQIAFGLEHIHRKGLIHRDVNPYNIMVTRDGTAKLADLGLAIDLAEEDRVTRDGATVGTFDYVAPEQARHSHAADIRSDIYSLGCTLYHMISGHVPFPSASLTEKLFAHQALAPTPLSQIVPGLADGLAEVVLRMMEKSPDDRYTSPILVAQALEPYCGELVHTSPEEDTSRIRRKLTSEQEAPGARTEQTHASGGEPDRGSRKTDVVPVVDVSSPASLVANSRSKPNNNATQTDVVPLDVNLSTTAVSGSGSKAVDNAGAATIIDNVSAATAAFRTPDDGSDETEAATPFALNLGHGPSLRGEMSLPKTPAVADSPAVTAIKSAFRRWPAHFWLWGLAALILTVTTVFVLTLAIRGWFGNSTPEPETGSVTNRRAGIKPVPAQPASTSIDQRQSTRDTKPDIVVRTEDGDETPVNNLFDAMQSAMGNRGWVELRNRNPIKLTCDQKTPCLAFGSGFGGIVVRAAPGTTPAIEVDLNGTVPLLETGSGVSLELSGLTFVVHYPKTGTTPYSAPAPLIAVAGKRTKIDRCAFRVVGDPRIEDSRAIVVKGSALDVERCWFQGFGNAIDVDAFSTVSARIRQTMFVPASGSALITDAPQPTDLFGWGVKLRVSTGAGPQLKNRPSHLIFERITLEGAGLLDLTGGPISTPLQIEVSHCAVRADALLAWTPVKSGKSLVDQAHWLGTGNQYHIQGRSWIVASTRGKLEASVNVTDLESWLHAAATDKQPIDSQLEFLTDPAARMDPFQPRDFAIKPTGSPRDLPGADPESVGPWSNR